MVLCESQARVVEPRARSARRASEPAAMGSAGCTYVQSGTNQHQTGLIRDAINIRVITHMLLRFWVASGIHSREVFGFTYGVRWMKSAFVAGAGGVEVLQIIKNCATFSRL